MCDRDGPKCYTVTWPTARKVHQCVECGGVIQPGEKYESFSGIWDCAQTFKTCSDCLALKRALSLRSEGRTWFGGLIDEIANFGPREELAFYRILKKRAPHNLERFKEWNHPEPVPESPYPEP